MKKKKPSNRRAGLKKSSSGDPLIIYLKEDARRLLNTISRQHNISPSDAGELILSSVLLVGNNLSKLQSQSKYRNVGTSSSLSEVKAVEKSNDGGIVQQLIEKLNKKSLQWNDVMNLFKAHQITPSEFQEFMNHALSLTHFRLAETACLFQLYDPESQNRFFSQLRYLRMKGVITLPSRSTEIRKPSHVSVAASFPVKPNGSEIIKQLIQKFESGKLKWNEVLKAYRGHLLTIGEFQEFMAYLVKSCGNSLVRAAERLQLHDREGQKRFFNNLRYFRKIKVLPPIGSSTEGSRL